MLVGREKLGLWKEMRGKEGAVDEEVEGLFKDRRLKRGGFVWARGLGFGGSSSAECGCQVSE